MAYQTWSEISKRINGPLSALGIPDEDVPANPFSIDASVVGQQEPSRGLASAPAPALNPYTLPNRGQVQPGTQNGIIRDERDLAQDSKTATNMNTYLDPNDYRHLLRAGMGYIPGYKTDENGKILRQQVVAKNSKGEPVFDKKGNPVYIDGAPIYDESKDSIDPSNPYQQAKDDLDFERAMVKNKLTNFKPQLDLTPLANLAQYLTGTRPQYSAPNNQTLDKAFDQASAITKSRSQLYKDAVDAVKSMKSGSQMDVINQLLTEKAINQSGGARPINPNSQMNSEMNAIEKSKKDLANIDKPLALANQFLSEAHSGIPLDENRIATIRASLDAHGRPNMAEMANEMDPSAKARLENFWTKITTGHMGEMTLNEQRESLGLVARYLQLRRNNEVAKQRTLLKAVGVRPEVVQAATLPGGMAQVDVHKDKPKADAPPKGAGPGGAQSFDEWVKSHK
jgi:hypothetical protein